MSRPLLILGATHPIGRALVDVAAREGKPVVAAAMDAEELRALKAAHRRADLQCVAGAASDPEAAAALVADLRALDRPLGGVIVAGCREPQRGRLLDQDEPALQEALRAELVPHWTALRALLPLLAEGGRNSSYTVIAGPGSDQPWAGYGLRSVAAAATRMLLRVAHDEARALSVRVQMLAVDMPTRTEENASHACSQWPTALAIAERALALADPARLREPAEAVVRFGWNAAPASDRRSVHAKAAATPRLLDDTWSALKPLLDASLSPSPDFDSET